MKAINLLIINVVFSCLLVRAYGASVSGEVDFDLRNRTVSTGHSYAEAYSVGIRADAPLSAKWRSSVYAERTRSLNSIQEAVVETDVSTGRLRMGLIRVPFGIYDTRETYASGLINYPLARSDYEYNAVDWGAPGAVWIGGSPNLQVEAAGFQGVSSGTWNNRNYTGGGAVRVQTYARDIVLGASRWDGYQSHDDSFAARRVVQMTGIDWRYTRPQVLIRGEYMAGTLAGDRMHGWYTDIYYRIPKFGKWTAVGRVEEFKPASDESSGRQVTAGARYIVAPDWDLSVNWLCNNGRHYYHDSWAQPTTHAGDWYFQIYHTIAF